MRFVASHRLLVGWVLGLVTAGAVAGGAGLAIIFGGLYNTNATDQHLKLVSWAVHNTMVHSVRRRAATVGPPQFDRATLLAGMTEYEAHCMACHGGPGISRAGWASAMLPTPPYLIGASQHWSRGELYTIVANGVKMTGMPAWGSVRPKDRIDAVVTLLQAMPKLTPDQFAALRTQAARAMTSTAPPSGQGVLSN